MDPAGRFGSRVLCGGALGALARAEIIDGILVQHRPPVQANSQVPENKLFLTLLLAVQK